MKLGLNSRPRVLIWITGLQETKSFYKSITNGNNLHYSLPQTGPLKNKCNYVLGFQYNPNQTAGIVHCPTYASLSFFHYPCLETTFWSCKLDFINANISGFNFFLQCVQLVGWWPWLLTCLWLFQVEGSSPEPASWMKTVDPERPTKPGLFSPSQSTAVDL